jgi:hypothetical protein
MPDAILTMVSGPAISTSWDRTDESIQSPGHHSHIFLGAVLGRHVCRKGLRETAAKAKTVNGATPMPESFEAGQPESAFLRVL